MNITVVAAWSASHVQSLALQLPERATVAEALAVAGLEAFPLAGLAVFGQRATLQTVLAEGDRLELLRALVTDPKEARRLRAEKSREAAGKGNKKARR